MNSYQQELGKRIREARLARGLSQEDLASAIGKKGGAVSKYERGDSDPVTEDLVKIAAICRIPISTLLLGEKAREGVSEPGPIWDSNLFDRELFTSIATMVREVEDQTGARIPPDKIAGIILMIYDDEIAGVEVPMAKVIQLVRLAA